MADTAPMTVYRREWVKVFEQRNALLRDTCITEGMIAGNQVVFPLGGSGGASATTRGMNGRIPARKNNVQQITAPLVEAHDKVEQTRFNFFTAQADMRQLQQVESVGVINREIDDIIIAELQQGTQDTGAAKKASLSNTLRARTILLNNKIDLDGNIHFVISPAYEAYMLQVPEFASSLYRGATPLTAGGASPQEGNRYMYAGLKWIVHNRLPGVGTANETCFMYHKNALGHAIDTAGMSTAAGYNEEDDFYFFRASVFHGAKLLQNSALVLVAHDGSEYVAE
ncbi:phage capsid protein [Xanthobacter flavus]|uniref:phage capsid protein n=1 Tax=Xanthobacter flavus TaxID=281 RepID=UPI00372B1B88